MAKDETSSQKTNLFVAGLVILGLMAVSIEPIIVKLGYQAHASTFQLMVLRTLVGGVLVLPFTRTFKWDGIKPFKELSFVSFLFIITNVLVFMSLHHLTAVTVITITTTTPAFVALVNQSRGRDILGAKFWIGFALCFFGVLLTIEVFKEGALAISALGLVYIFLSVIASTIYRAEMDILTHKYSPISITNYIFLTSGIVALFCLPFITPLPNPKETIPMGLWLGFAALVANLAFLAAIKIIGSTRISIFGILQRPLIIIACCFILHESLNLPQIIGIFMVLVGVQMSKVKRAKHLLKS